MRSSLPVALLTLALGLACTGAATPDVPAVTEPVVQPTTPTPTAPAEPEKCCCEYTPAGATDKTHEEMVRSSCESWGYTCVADATCEAADKPADTTADKPAEADKPATTTPKKAPVTVVGTSHSTKGGGTASSKGGGTTTKPTTTTKGGAASTPTGPTGPRTSGKGGGTTR